MSALQQSHVRYLRDGPNLREIHHHVAYAHGIVTQTRESLWDDTLGEKRHSLSKREAVLVIRIGSDIELEASELYRLPG